MAKHQFNGAQPASIASPNVMAASPAGMNSDEAVAPEPHGWSSLGAQDLGPELVSGGNPLVAAANRLLNLLPQIRAMATQVDAGEFRHFLLARIRQFEATAGSTGVSRETIIGARYCLCTALDEAAAQTPWGGSGVWPQHSLLVALHNETWGGEKFFQLLAKLVQTPSQHLDLLELMYFCLLLGFEGRYRILDNGRSQLETLKARLLQIIESARGDRGSALSVRWLGVERKANPPWTLVPLWMAGALTALAAFGVFLWFSFSLASQSDALYAHIDALRFPRIKAAATVAVKPRLRQFLEPEIHEGLVEVNDEPDRSTILLRGDGVFPPGSANVKPAYQHVIERVGTALEQVPGKVLVNGYTDNVPIRTAQFPSNWQLSQVRAQAVSGMLRSSVRDSARLQAQGRAEADPIASNASAEGRARNRRVEIVLQVAPQLRDQQLQDLAELTGTPDFSSRK